MSGGYLKSQLLSQKVDEEFVFFFIETTYLCQLPSSVWVSTWPPPTSLWLTWEVDCIGEADSTFSYCATCIDPLATATRIRRKICKICQHAYCVYSYIYIYIYIYIYVCVYIYMYVYIYCVYSRILPSVYLAVHLCLC